MPHHVEPLDKGLVTARDPSLLRPGELTKMDNACYKPHSLSVHKSPQKASFNNTSLGGTVSGLRYCAFDFINVISILTVNQVTVNAMTGATFTGVRIGARAIGENIPANATVVGINNPTTLVLSQAASATSTESVQYEAENLLVAQANNAYHVAVAADTGEFTSIGATTEGETFDTIHYENQHVVINGKNVNKILKADRTIREHGLKPVATAPTPTIVSGGWSVPSGTGWYAYWYTEYDKANDVESDFVGKPEVINVTNTTSAVSLRRYSGRVNPTATHWRAYRSVKIAETTAARSTVDLAKPFPDGVLAGEAELKDDGTQEVIVDGGTIASTAARTATGIGFNYATTAGPSWVAVGGPGTLVGNLTTSDNFYARVTRSGAGDFSNLALELTNFGFTGSNITALPITGIQVSVEAKRNNVTAFGGLRVVVLGKGHSLLTASVSKNVPLTTTDATVTLGSTTDRWGGPSGRATPSSPEKEREWTLDDMTDGNFRVFLIASLQSVNDIIDVDRVAVTVSFGSGKQAGDLDLFPALTLRPFGVPVSIGRNGLPPRATTGDIFQDSLVLNDVTDESILRYSWPAKIDAFPSLYFLNFETKDQDRITNIKTVGNSLIVGLSSQIYRVQYLPRDVDAEFDRGRAIELIEVNHGIVGPRAAAVFSMGDGTQILAYVSRFGIHRTDGYRTYPITNDLNWEAMIDLTNIHKTIVVNNPERYEIQVYYVPNGSFEPNVLTRRIRLNYHPMHIKEDGGLKVSGPDTVATTTAALAVLSNGARPLYSGNENGIVWLENQGAVGSMTVRTRKMYLSSVGSEWKLGGTYLHHTLNTTSIGSPYNITITPVLDKVNTAARTGTAKNVAVPAFTSPEDVNYPEDHRMLYTPHHEQGEAATLTLTTSSASGVKGSFDYLTIEGEDFGPQDSKF